MAPPYTAPPAAGGHRVSGEFILGGGSPSDFGQAAQNSIKTVLAVAANVSADAVSLTLTAGSVVVAYQIIVANAAEAAASRDGLVTGPLATASALQAALTDRFAADRIVSAPVVQVQAITQPRAASVDEASADEADSITLIAIIAGSVGVAIAVGVCIAIYFLGCCQKGPHSTAVVPPLPGPVVANDDNI